MCGIAGFHVLAGQADPAALNRLAASLLIGIDHRGGDATGAGSFGPGTSRIQRASCRARGFLSEWHGVPDDAQTVLLHTRWATQGKAAFPENNHPVASGPVHVVHNGHITNDAEIFAKTGKQRTGHVDSEAIPASILNAGWTNAPAALERLNGSFAIAAVHLDHPGDLLLAKSGWSPLVYVTNGKLIVWASETAAIDKAWREAYGGKAPQQRHYLTSGDLVQVTWQGEIIHKRFKSTEPQITVATAGWIWDDEADDQWTTPKTDPKKRGTISTALSHVQRYVWNAEDLLDLIPDEDEDDLDIVEIRCGCCDEWTSAKGAREVYGELVCPACEHELTIDLKRAH